MTPQVTLSAIAVGELIREQIAAEAAAIPEPPLKLKNMPPSSPGPQLFKDINGVPFGLGDIYLGKTVYTIVRCKLQPNQTETYYKNGHVYPVNKHGQIIRPNGTKSTMRWHEFRNNYTFGTVAATTQPELTETQKTAKGFTYEKYEAKARNIAGEKAVAKAYNGVIRETIEHCKNKQNMTVLKSNNIFHDLKNSTFWNELGHNIPGTARYHRFDNTTMGSTIWKFRGKWIISSHSAYLNLINKEE